MKSEYVEMLIKGGAALVVSGLVIGTVSYVGSLPVTAEVSDEAEVSSVFPTRDDVTYKTVDAPAASNDNDVTTAEDWAEIYPEIYASYTEGNSSNNYVISYLEQDPYLTNIYEGYGFAKDYGSAEAHNYTLQDVGKTERPHALANCLTCKTADYTALVNKLGTSAYSMDFEEVYGMVSENVGCYTCHENNAGNEGELTLTHDYTVAALSDDLESGAIAADVLVCGQCHIEYYFDPETKATSVAYTDVASMSPDAILAYYDEMGFSDWTQESTGTGMLKAQHPEMETYLGEGSVHASMGLSCADCHMATETSEDGTVYISHNLQSPLENESLLNTCAQCHGDTDMVEKVHTIQDAVTARENEVGNKLSDLKDTLADAVASGDYSEDELNEIRSLYRSAQWYFDFDYVENSEGAHNSTLANYCLDTSEDYISQAMELFK